ncbi:uncharacterized protein LOC124168369 [Ischnura elegans]|uniref:uncharacterized protein LOC124168369 n=1 Tax=Ischnura elegans TaxID=197161 RepID=UPI001ED8965B|nr:uncharacterized protein LOC124168369 [Ischnura elegans]
MEKLIRGRNALKIQITRLMTDIEKLLYLKDEEPDHLALEVELTLMNDVVREWEEICHTILKELEESEASEEALADEMQVVMNLRRRFTVVQRKCERIIKPIQTSETSLTEMDTISNTGSVSKRRLKLPKIELQKFDGKLKSWLGWWSHFRKIHDDDTLTDSDKVEYLSQATEKGTEAEELVESYPADAKNYPNVIGALKERFGRKDLLVQVYIRELLNLVITNTNGKEEMSLSSCYFKLNSHLRSLEALKLGKVDPETFIFPLVESGLSEEILRPWHRSSFSKTEGNQLKALMEFMRVEVRSVQQTYLAKAGFHSSEPVTSQSTKGGMTKKGNWKSRKEDDIPTAAGLVASPAPQRHSCGFCNGGHETMACVKAQAMNLDERKQKLGEKKVCYVCFRGKHKSRDCRSHVKCIVCQGKHYPLLCLQ